MRPAGLSWLWLLSEFGYGSGPTCWRRLKEWHEAGVWKRVHQILFERLAYADQLDWSRASVDSFTVPTLGGAKTGANPTGRGKPGTKCHLVVEARGVPLAAVLSATYVHDSRVMLEVVAAIEPIRHCRRGWPRKRPGKLHADKAYDSPDLRTAPRQLGITPRLARRCIESSDAGALPLGSRKN